MFFLLITMVSLATIGHHFKWLIIVVASKNGCLRPLLSCLLLIIEGRLLFLLGNIDNVKEHIIAKGFDLIH